MNDRPPTFRTAAPLTVVAICFACACQKPEGEPAAVKRASTPTPTPASIATPGFDAPPARLAVPQRIMAMRVRDEARAGTITFAGEEPRVLNGIGLNSCQNGWVLQAYFRDAEGKFAATDPVALELASVPTKAFVHTNDVMAGAKVGVDFSTFSETRLTGTFAVLNPDGSPHFEVSVDAEPTNVTSSRALGQNGCFTTGEFRINGRALGPTHGVWDGRNLYLARLRFDATHEMEVALEAQPFQRRPESVFVGDFAKLLKDPIGAPARFVFTTLENRSPISADAEVGALLERTRIPAPSGKARARFGSTDSRGPLRWKLENVVVPKWDGPYSGQTLDVIDVEVQFPDVKTGVIPTPQPSTWLQN